MPLPFDERGLLPPGIHDATPDEVKFYFAQFQRSDRRLTLFDKLKAYLTELAKTDFKAAVGKGDKPGSMDNAGRIPRGVLEAAPEYVLFSLPKGGVSEPVDTPRGYWIVQRIE